MSTWGLFWICWFSFLSVKYIVNVLTYDKKQAIKDLTKEECEKIIDDEVSTILEDIGIVDIIKNLKELKK